MQICEDVQLILGHHLVQSLNIYAQEKLKSSLLFDLPSKNPHGS